MKETRVSNSGKFALSTFVRIYTLCTTATNRRPMTSRWLLSYRWIDCRCWKCSASTGKVILIALFSSLQNLLKNNINLQIMFESFLRPHQSRAVHFGRRSSTAAQLHSGFGNIERSLKYRLSCCLPRGCEYKYGLFRYLRFHERQFFTSARRLSLFPLYGNSLMYFFRSYRSLIP